MAKELKRSAASAIDELTSGKAESPVEVAGDLDTAAEGRLAIELENARLELEAVKAETERLKAEAEAAKKNSAGSAASVIGSEFFKITIDGILIPDADGKTVSGIVSVEELRSVGLTDEAISKYKLRGILVPPDFTPPPGWWSDGRPAPDSRRMIDGEMVPVGQGQIGTLTRQTPMPGGIYV